MNEPNGLDLDLDPGTSTSISETSTSTPGTSTSNPGASTSTLGSSTSAPLPWPKPMSRCDHFSFGVGGGREREREEWRWGGLGRDGCRECCRRLSSFLCFSVCSPSPSPSPLPSSPHPHPHPLWKLNDKHGLRRRRVGGVERRAYDLGSIILLYITHVAINIELIDVSDRFYELRVRRRGSL